MSNLTTLQKLCILALAWLIVSTLHNRGMLPVGTAPIDAPGLNVLVVTEPNGKLPSSQVIQINTITDYVEELGGQARVMRPGEASPNFEQHWRDALARPRTTLPWLIVSNQDGLNSGGVEKPLPLTYEETKQAILSVK